MTEQEAEVWAARLTRIWWRRGAPPQVEYKKGVFHFQTVVDGSTNLDFAILFVSYRKNEWEFELGYQAIGLTCKDGEVTHSWGRPKQPEFNEQYLPFFRRCCWLSGCAIEASAHEKAEWIQGFSLDEINAWQIMF